MNVRLAFAGGFYQGYAISRNTSAYQVQEKLIAQGFEPLQAPFKKGEDVRDDLQKCLRTLTFGQAHAILDKYVTDHPERWDKQMADLAEEAFIDACEKRAKNP